MGKLLSKDRDAYIAEIATKQAAIREAHVSSQKRPLLSVEEARKRRLALAFTAAEIPPPPFLGTRNLDLALSDLVPWIDWSPLFHTWELSGRYPAILEDPKKGDAARKVFADAQALLAKIVADGSLTARATYGYFPAGSNGDDIIHVFSPDRSHELAAFPMPRQREDKETCLSLADFIAPLATVRGTTIPPDSVIAGPANRLPIDHLGAFIVTAGIGTDELAAHFERDHDDYTAIMAKALADRLAEAAAEYLHARVRREWYAPDENLAHAAILAETYRGIRPAFGYPACPDHAPKGTLFALLDNASHHGVTLTESFAMYPTASVSGLYFAHPKSQYFAVGRNT
jgi:5-methyltetrahydrofolate--homocysteine methyltransferase